MAKLYQFSWQALDSMGALQSGESLLKDREALLHQLSDRGLLIVSWQRGRAWHWRDWKWQQKIELMEQLSTLLKAGLPLAESLTLLAQDHPHSGWRIVLNELQQQVMAGQPFSRALQSWPRLFPPLFSALVQVGETTGQLDSCCLRLARQQIKQRQLRQKTAKALRYPLFILLVALLVSAGMLLFVLPEFVAVYASFEAPLPAFTAGVVALSELLQRIALPLLVLTTLLALAVRQFWRRSARCQRWAEQLLLRMPLIAPLWRGAQLSQIYAILALTQQAGLTLLQSLQAVEITLTARLWREAIAGLQTHIAAGAPLHQALQQHALFTPLCAQLIGVGEEAGALDTMLARLAEWHETETSARAEVLAAALEPAMMLVVGAIVGTLVIAMYLPVFSLGEVIG